MEIETNVISIVSRKGGTGKTTTAFNLAYCLAEYDRKVLLIDLDSQCNLSDTINLDVNTNINDVVNGNISINQAIHNTDIKNIDLIPASVNLANLEAELSDQDGKETILKDKLEELKGIYDYIIIDTAPALDTLVINSLVASDYALITVRTSLYSFKGIEQVIEIIELVQQSVNPKLDILGILVTQIDKRTNISKEFIDDLKELYNNKVFNASISQNVAIVESTLEGMPVRLYDEEATASKQYKQLAEEIKRRELL